MPIYKITNVNEETSTTGRIVMTTISAALMAITLGTPLIIDFLAKRQNKRKLKKGISVYQISEEDLNKINYMEADSRELALIYKISKKASIFVPKYNSIIEQIVKDFKNGVPQEESYKKLRQKIISLKREVVCADDLIEEYKKIKVNLNKTEQDYTKLKSILKTMKDTPTVQELEYPDGIDRDNDDELEEYQDYSSIFVDSKDTNIWLIEDTLFIMCANMYDILEDITVKVVKRKK